MRTMTASTIRGSIRGISAVRTRGIGVWTSWKLPDGLSLCGQEYIMMLTAGGYLLREWTRLLVADLWRSDDGEYADGYLKGELPFWAATAKADAAYASRELDREAAEGKPAEAAGCVDARARSCAGGA